MLDFMDAYCTRCVGTQLVPRLREGIEIDICPSCRGVWLDRGELEKLLALARREADAEAGYRSEEPPSSSRRGSQGGYGNQAGGYGNQGGHQHRGGHDHHHGDDRHGHHGQRKKHGLLATLGDLFD